MAIIGSHGPKHRPPRSRALLAALVLGGSLGLSGTADGFVYWDGYVASPTSIDRANLDGSGVTAPFVTVGNDNPCGVAVDHGHIYWGGSSGSEIGRANLDGSGATNGFVTGAVEPCGVAVDAAHVYWASYGRGAPGVGTTIGRASLDGTGVNQSFVTGAVSPCGVAVDAGHVYWANSGSGTIGRANLDGSGADQSFITGATQPCGVAVDAGHVYWTDRLPNGGGTIGRANLDGTGADQSFIADAAAGAPMGGTLCGIAVDAGHVYWDTSDFGSGGRIVRANLDGTGVDRGFVTIPGAGSASTPCGVAVDALLPSTVTVSGSPSSSVYGQPVSLTATVVNAPSPAPIIPTGAVQFAINGDTVGDPVALGPDGRATFTPPDPLDVGDEVTAEYTGNAQLGPSTSPILVPAVQPAASSLVLRSSANPQTADGVVTFTARVTNLNTGIVPFGSVQFVLDGQPTLAPVPLDPSGEAAIVVSGFDPGDVVVAALYHDDTGTPADFTDSQATLTEHITSVSAATPSPVSLGFGPVTLGASSALQTVTVTNTGRSTLHIGRVTLAGADPQDFALATDGCTGVSLDQASGSTPAGTCAVVVRFAPTAPGDRTGALRLASDDPAGPLVLALAGSGVPPAGPPPPPPPAPGVPGIPAQSPSVNAGGTASAKLTCAGATSCAGTLELLYPAVGGAKRNVIAHARFTIVAGRTSTVALRLDQAGRSLLRRSHQGRVHVIARVQATVGAQARTLTRTIVLRRRSVAVKRA